MKIAAVIMIRNEIDIAFDFLSYHEELFDEIFIADMQSSDGTTEIIDSFAKKTAKFKRFNLPYLAKYQAESLTSLSKLAFENGADWVFFIDSDEFLKVKSRQDLEHKLEIFGAEVMHLPWINLVPSSYGSFEDFDLKQEFYWSGRVSKHLKVAISGQYALSNPHYALEAGSHNVKPDLNETPEETRLGVPLLHVPVRSIERITYKAANALDLQSRKHNQIKGEGFHHQSNKEILNGKNVDSYLLNGIAQDYGSDEPIRPIDPKALGWPKIQIDIPEKDRPLRDTPSMNSRELRQLDFHRNWVSLNQPPGAVVRANLKGDEIQLEPQAIRGNGKFGPNTFGRLPKCQGAMNNRFDTSTISSALNASLLPHPVDVSSAWTDLVPTLGMIFSIAKPRRFVELGTHNGMSYFSACQLSEKLKLDTECVAIDSWEGDPHASFHAPQVFIDFERLLKSSFPSQMYMKTYFDEAANVFDESSIDLLHIDGFHSYDAVKSDFETWLPKMSDRGVIIFHDTNVHERDFGVWRFWLEINQKYPHFEVYHGHGLGILYVGGKDSDIAQVFTYLAGNSDFRSAALTFLESQIGAKKLYRQVSEEQKELEQQLAETTQDLNTIANDKWWLRTKTFRRWSNSIRKMRGRPKKHYPKPVD